MKKFNQNSIAVVTILAISFALGFTGPISALAFASPATVNLGTAGNFVTLAKSGISTTGATSITGNIGVSPAAASTITGFGLTMDISNTFSISALVTGKAYAADYTPPTPATMTTAISNMEAAYTDANSRAVNNIDLVGLGGSCVAGTCDLAGLTMAPGVYTFTGPGNVIITGDVTLNGGANDVWIFQIPGTLNISSGKKILLAGGAVSANVFWAVAGVTTLGTSSTFEGNILEAGSVIALQTGAILHGRALSQFAVTLDANTISAPIGSIPATLHVIKLVVGGTATPSAFTVHVKSAGVDVSGSPLAGTAAPGTSYSLSSGTYVVSEDVSASYTQSFSGACDASGSVTLSAGDDKTCTIINTDIPVPAPVIPPITNGGGVGYYISTPLISILKVPSPLVLPAGPGPVIYRYTVWNSGGQQAGQLALTGVTVADDKCSPVVFLSGDLNGNGKLDTDEKWEYRCTATLAKTTTNTSVATGYSDDIYHQAAIATAIATVVVGEPSLQAAIVMAVGAPLPPPLINIVKVPSRLTPFPFGGGDVTYTYTVTNPGVVAMHDVVVTDDKCSPVSRTSGDTNGNSLLDTSEVWTYACQTNIPVSTRNVASAEGKANSFTALGYAFANVLVLGATTPSFPNTGFSTERTSIPWDIAVLAGTLLLASVLFAAVLKKRAIKNN